MQTGDYAILAHCFAHGWLGLSSCCLGPAIDALLTTKQLASTQPDQQPAVVIESRGPNNLERSCQ